VILGAGSQKPVDGLLWPLRGISQDVLSIPLYSDAAESHFEMLTPLDRAADYEGAGGRVRPADSTLPLGYMQPT